MKIASLIVCLFLSACSASSPTLGFHGLPENGAVSDDDSAVDEAIVGSVTDDYVGVTSSALDASDRPEAAPSAFLGDRVPWHMEYFLTDLSVSASGLLGGLIMKGTPAVTFIWRKQHAQNFSKALDRAIADAPDLSVTNTTKDSDMALQLEPAMRMAVASGRVKDKSKLRASLLSAARDFQALGASIGENPGHQWWVSRLRLDLTLDAQGVVTPVIGVGGDIRFRFEWHRIMKAASAPPASTHRLGGVSPSSLREFIGATAEDLSALSEDAPRPDGFKAYSYRVGIGMSAKGNIGIVKSSASLIGQVYFSRDVAKPKVHSFTGEVSPDTINLIEPASAVSHADFAFKHDIPAEQDGDQVVYKVDRKKIRKGLARAGKMGLLFGKHAAQGKGHWKVFELRTALDLSITGKVGLTEVSGLATSEINFYNQSF